MIVSTSINDNERHIYDCIQYLNFVHREFIHFRPDARNLFMHALCKEFFIDYYNCLEKNKFEERWNQKLKMFKILIFRKNKIDFQCIIIRWMKNSSSRYNITIRKRTFVRECCIYICIIVAIYNLVHDLHVIVISFISRSHIKVK